MRSHSQDSTNGEVSPRGNFARSGESDPRDYQNQVSPNSKSATPTTKFFANSGVADGLMTNEPVSPVKETSNIVEEGSKGSSNKLKSSSGTRKKGRGVSIDASTGKVADSLAEWDPFFESDDL
jgi:hypothetical protein